jgi:hypothetical protein
MALSSEPTDRSRAASRMRAVAAFVTGLALIVAGLDVALASPAAAQVLRRPGTVVGAADNAHHINAAAIEVLIEVQLRAPAPCRKHACRAAPSKTTAIEVLFVYVFAGQSQRTAVICAEFASGPAYAGGDPVNGGDPSGDEWCLRLGWGSLHCWGTETPPLPADGTSCESFESLQVNQDSAGVAINQGNCSSGSGPVPNTLINYWNGSWNNTPVTAVQTTTALDLLASTPTYEGECDGIWIACLQYWVYPAPATNGTVTIGATTLAVTTPTDVHTYIPSLQTDDILSNGFAYWIEQLLFHEDHRQTDFEIATNLSDAAEVIDNALELAGATVGGPTNCTAGGTRGLPV